MVVGRGRVRSRLGLRKVYCLAEVGGSVVFDLRFRQIWLLGLFVDEVDSLRVCELLRVQVVVKTLLRRNWHRAIHNFLPRIGPSFPTPKSWDVLLLLPLVVCVLLLALQSFLSHSLRLVQALWLRLLSRACDALILAPLLLS